MSASEIPPSQFLTRDFYINGSSRVFRDQAQLDRQLERFGEPRTLGRNIFPLEIFYISELKLVDSSSSLCFIWLSKCFYLNLNAFFLAYLVHFDIIPATSYVLYPDPNSNTTYCDLCAENTSYFKNSLSKPLRLMTSSFGKCAEKVILLHFS